MKFDTKYWEKFYTSGNKIKWDIGYCATPLKAYFDQLTNKDLKILVPGAGNAWEVEYLFKNGFRHVYLMDYIGAPIQNFLKRVPDFPENQIIQEDFFKHQGSYDLIVEQTFFSSIPRSMRYDYVCKVHDLLNDFGKFVGLLFNHEFNSDEPPFGGSELEYSSLFKPCFNFQHFETAYNSIKPRRDREIFILLVKKDYFCPCGGSK